MTEKNVRRIFIMTLVILTLSQSYLLRSLFAALALSTIVLVPLSLVAAVWFWLWNRYE